MLTIIPIKDLQDSVKNVQKLIFLISSMNLTTKYLLNKILLLEDNLYQLFKFIQERASTHETTCYFVSRCKATAYCNLAKHVKWPQI